MPWTETSGWRSTGILLILAGLAAASWWLTSGLGDRPSGTSRDSRSPEYIIEDLEARVMGPNGQPRQILRSPRVVHYDTEDKTSLEHPHLSLYGRDAPPWEIQSEAGTLLEKGDLVWLHGRVEIESAEGPEHRPYRILTRDLRVRPHDDYAETDQHIEVFSLEDWIRADGAQVWFGEPRKLRFLSHTRGYYVVQ